MPSKALDAVEAKETLRLDLRREDVEALRLLVLRVFFVTFGQLNVLMVFFLDLHRQFKRESQDR